MTQPTPNKPGSVPEPLWNTQRQSQTPSSDSVSSKQGPFQADLSCPAGVSLPP